VTGSIHPSAVIDPSAVLAEGVRVGPFAVIGAGVEIGSGTEVGAGAQIQGPTRIGRENRIFAHACLGFDPQDLKFSGEATRLEVGDRNHFREFCTVHRGTGKGGGLTTIGSDNLFMAYSHVAHDCHVGSGTIFANNATLAGHVEVGDHATVGAFSAVHQFARVGPYAYIGGFSVITMDALPYVKTVGYKPACYGINRIGLERKGFDEAQLERLERAYRLLLRSKLGHDEALATIERELGGHPEIDRWVAFVRSSRRGVIKTLPGRGVTRGA
jgi:UDP-N-acetylglucosamine acyltransferase